MKKLIAVAINDFRLVFRDNSLKIFIALPLLNLLVIRYGVPYVGGVFEGVRDYIAVILMLATMQGSTAFGFIYSMVLVDEKDTSVASVYGILPVSKFWFVAFRLIPPFVLSTLATVSLLLVEPFYGLPLIFIFAYSALTGLVAPMIIMFIPIIAKNKIEAMTWLKLLNIPLYLPIAAFFVPTLLSMIFAIFPTFWAYHSFNESIARANPWPYLLVGYAYSILVLAWLIRSFTRSHFR